ncbi:hypothetical protein KEM60_01715 [Austwickia sp. TVS 96-490-7B]|nr:hypothetical protein [Austwickia sp. TVS 96-490-7B]
MVLDSSHDVERLIGHPLSKDQVLAFNKGGLLVPDSHKSIQLKSLKSLPTKDHQGRDTGVLHITHIQDVPDAYAQYLGFISSGKARQAGWRLDQAFTVYDNVSPIQISDALKAPDKKGFDPNYVQIYKVPEKITVPETLVWSATGTGVLFVLLTCWVAASHTKALREYRNSLIAIGLSHRLLFGITLTVLLFVVAIPAFVGLGVALLANHLAWGMILESGRSAFIPWEWIMNGMLMTALSITFGTLVGAFMLRRQS